MSSNPWYRLPTFQTALALARVLPRKAAQPLAAGIGSLSYSLAGRGREIIRDNLATASGLDGPRLDDLCRANYRNFLKMLADYFYTAGAPVNKVRPLLSEWRGFEHLTAARERGKGTIIITGHIGNWELGGVLLAAEGFPVSVISLEEPAPELTKWREEYRKRLGIKTITVGTDKFAFVEMINTLKRNEFVAMLIDRPYAQSGVPVKFFGKETLFSGAPLPPLETYRSNGAARFRFTK